MNALRVHAVKIVKRSHFVKNSRYLICFVSVFIIEERQVRFRRHGCFSRKSISIPHTKYGLRPENENLSVPSYLTSGAKYPLTSLT